MDPVRAIGYGHVMRKLLVATIAGALLAAFAGDALGAKRPRHRRPGCGTFCQNAGGLGGAPSGKPLVTIRRQHLEMTSDGVVFLRATCNRRRACVGATLLIAVGGPELGRSDLRIAARRTATVGVSLSRRGIRYVRLHDDVRSDAVVVLMNQAPVSFSGSLTVSN
jgi:hypothetical protein